MSLPLMIIMILLVLLMLGALPGTPWMTSWNLGLGYYPSAGVLVVLIILLLVFL